MKRLHHAWLICLGGTLSLCISMGLGVNVFSVYQPKLIEVLNLTNAQGSWITTIRTFFILGTLFVVNRVCEKLGLRLTITLGAVLLGTSCLCYSAANSFAMCCVAAALTGIGYCLGGMVPLTLIIDRWFLSRRSLALGIGAAGSGVSTILAPPILTWLMENKGLSTAFLAEGVTILIFALCLWLLLRSDPSDLGLTPYEEAGASSAETAARNGSRLHPMSRSMHIALIFAVMLTGAPGGPGFSHLGVLYTSSGYDSMMVATITSYLGILVCAGKVFAGQLYDRLGGRRGNLFCFGAFTLSMVLCALTPLAGGHPWFPFIGITFFGLGAPIAGLASSLWAADLFSEQNYENGVRRLNMAFSLGMLITGPIPGILADHFGSYAYAYALFALALLISFLIVQALYYKRGVGHKKSRA